MIVLLLMFTVVPALELYGLIKVGGMIGVLETIWIVLITGVVGAYAAKMQGFSVLQELQKQSASGQFPGKTIIHGLCVLVGGILLVTPGFFTDALGLALIFPLTRVVFVYFFQKQFVGMVKRGSLRFYSNVNSAGFSQDFGQPPFEDFRPNGPRPGFRDVTPEDPEKLNSSD